MAATATLPTAAEVADMRRDIERRVSEGIDRVHAHITKLEEQLGRAGFFEVRKKRKLERALAELKTLPRIIQTLGATFYDTQADYEQACKDLDAARLEVGTVQSEVTAKENAHAALVKRREEANAQLDALERQRATSHLEGARAQSYAAAAADSHALVAQAIDNLRDAVSRCEARVASTKTAKDDAEAAVAKLKRDVEAAIAARDKALQATHSSNPLSADGPAVSEAAVRERAIALAGVGSVLAEIDGELRYLRDEARVKLDHDRKQAREANDGKKADKAARALERVATREGELRDQQKKAEEAVADNKDTAERMCLRELRAAARRGRNIADAVADLSATSSHASQVQSQLTAATVALAAATTAFETAQQSLKRAKEELAVFEANQAKHASDKAAAASSSAAASSGDVAVDDAAMFGSMHAALVRDRKTIGSEVARASKELQAAQRKVDPATDALHAKELVAQSWATSLRSRYEYSCSESDRTMVMSFDDAVTNTIAALTEEEEEEEEHPSEE